ncbi:molybdopterin converting factor subunit 1 [Haloferax elongans ATCC BAA-1513]|uniref:Molybdopterin converting factor subunit 1 n=1 Tax=Haloferax elongans ATCC BAA-1513 TaxID=1230453 RepID=M0HI44_HALEO|nr:ubiquitin-like small modifier protein 1 [Haloferax elongans]ELZ82764.1 molybdopterin converting factor subunit 1 [Haloferax elongans ATCC BAA-1513]
MELELRFFATFREAVGQKTLHWQVEDGATVGDVLHALESEYDGLTGSLLEGGEIRPHVNVLKNGREVVHLDGLETALDEGDTVSVFPPVAGG